MHTVRPIFKKLLLAAIAIFIVGVAIILSDLYHKVGRMEHALMHVKCEHNR